VTLVGQLVFGIALGYEDLNDHDESRRDPLMAVLAGKLEAQREDCAPVAGKSTLIFLLQGEFVVSAQAAGEIARLGAGEIVGEMSFVDSAPPSATVTAAGGGLALFLDKATVAQKLAADVACGCRFYRAPAIFLADRRRGTVRRMGQYHQRAVRPLTQDRRHIAEVAAAIAGAPRQGADPRIAEPRIIV
jgi:CRP-like cAMP-binding protein